MTADANQPGGLEDAARATDQREHREEMKPGDEAPPGDPLAGENVCRACGGSGDVDGSTCEACAGTGKTTSIVSGGP
jgi:DnaJ-class molecular chaperone